METITRNVRDLDQSERSVMERFVGHQLHETQQITLNIMNRGLNTPGPAIDETLPDVPDHWRIYEGLSDAEVDELDREIRQRANLTRHFE